MKRLVAVLVASGLGGILAVAPAAAGELNQAYDEAIPGISREAAVDWLLQSGIDCDPIDDPIEGDVPEAIEGCFAERVDTLTYGGRTVYRTDSGNVLSLNGYVQWEEGDTPDTAAVEDYLGQLARLPYQGAKPDDAEQRVRSLLGDPSCVSGCTFEIGQVLFFVQPATLLIDGRAASADGTPNPPLLPDAAMMPEHTESPVPVFLIAAVIAIAAMGLRHRGNKLLEDR